MNENTSNDAELEARIVAWVAGEASPLEVAELQKLVATRPELAIFKRRIEAVHGLLGEAARPEQQPLRLSSERREKLLAAMGAPADATTDAKTVSPTLLVTKAAQRNRRWIYTVGSAAAACAIFALSITSLSKRAYDRHPADAQIAAVEGYKLQSEQTALENQKAGGQPQFDALPAPTAPVPTEPPTILFDRGPAPKREDSVAIQVPRVDFNVPAEFQDKNSGAVRNYAPPLQPEGGANTAVFGAGGVGGNLSLEKSIQPPPGLTLSAAGNATSRDGAAAATDEIVRLDPFNVSATSDVGFVAASSLAGGRMATALKDSPVPFRELNTVFGPAVTVDGVAVTGDTASDSIAGPGPGGFPRFRLTQPDAPAAPVPSSLAEQTVKLEPFSVAPNPPRGFGASSGLVGSRIVALDNESPASNATKETPAAKSKGLFGGLFGRDADAKKAEAAAPGSTDGQIVGGAAAGPLSARLEREVARLREERKQTEASIQLEPFAVQGDAGRPAAAKRDAPPAGAAAKPAKAQEQDAARPIEPRIAQLDAEKAGRLSEETATAQVPMSTFSLHVSDVSFRLAQAALARGEMPDASRIRPEEFYNAFDYGDPTPSIGEKVGAKIEQSAHPMLQQRNLVRVAMKVPSTGRGSGTPLRLTVLLDTSGSMEREDRAASVRRAFEVLVSLLGPNDRITLIGFARQPRLLAENLAGNQARSLLDVMSRTPADGGTNLEQALALGGELALRHRAAGAQNRVVLLTDGAANLGSADPAALAQRVETLRQQGVAFDACGVGMTGIDDDILESLTRQGDGRYYVLNSAEAADAGFARQLAGAFRPAAENVKVQVQFNPARVARHRLVGFEQHRLATEDFRNDRVDAAELAAEEAAVALYQVEVLPQGSGELGEVFVRFRDAATGEMVERSWTIRYEANAPVFTRATPAMQLAGTSALLAEKLRRSPLGGQFTLGDFSGIVDGLRRHYAPQARVQEFAAMYAQARRLLRE